MIQVYTLDSDDKPVPALDIRAWGEWYEGFGNRQAAEDWACGVRVSTVFLGIDCNYSGEGPPILWETMVFGGVHDQSLERYSSLSDARLGHRRWLKRVKSVSVWTRLWLWLGEARPSC